MNYPVNCNLQEDARNAKNKTLLKTKSFNWPVLSYLLVGLMSASAVHAENNANKETSYTLEEITVTAQKREEKVQNIPISVNVLNDQQIEDANIKDTTELIRYIPNVYTKDSGSYQQINIRGVGSFVTSLYPTTAMYIDDINLPIVYMQNQELFDVERVEVLKGPQGTLYGRNSEAGVINIVTRQPDNDLRGKVFTQLSVFDTDGDWAPGYQLGANVSTPIVTDIMYFSLAGKWNYDQGPITNDFNNDDEARKINRGFGRTQLRWTPTEQLDISFLGDISSSDENFGYGRYKDGMFKTERLHIARNDKNNRNWNGDSESLRVKYKGEEIDLTSITGRRYFSDDANWDMDMTTLPTSYMNTFMTEKVDMWTQEFRFSSSEKNESPLAWLLGIYGFTEDTKVTGDYLAGMPGMSNNTYRNTDIDSDGFALFGQGTYTIIDRLHLTAGLRYEYNSQWGEQRFTSEMEPNYPTSTMNYKKHLTGDELLPKFSVSYDFTDDVMGYATASRGFLSGGFDYVSATNNETFYYEPEYTWNYEVGVKTSWLDNKLLANLAAFYIDMTDKQVSEVLSLNQAKISNIAEANSKGLEIELQARPATGLTFSGGFGYTMTEITNWYDSVTQYDYHGNELPNAPRFTYNLSTMYQHSTGLYGRVDLLGTGKFYHDATNMQEESAYELVNIRLGYSGEHWDVSLWCKNLFDRSYYTVQAPIPGYGTLAFDGDPRQIGMTVAWRF